MYDKQKQVLRIECTTHEVTFFRHHRNAGQIGRILKRLRLHGLIQRIGRTYKYYVTQLGQKLLIAALKLKEHLIIPELQPTSYASLNS